MPRARDGGLLHAFDPLLGRCIAGRYDVVSVIAEGGAAVVYEAIQRGLGRPVALKVMRPAARVDAVLAARFEREARAVSVLDHPNVVSVFDVGRLRDGRVFLVMARIEGVDLAALLEDRGPVPLERAIELLRGPARALDRVHAAGLLHRDVKPENLVLERLANGEEIVRLVDFGLAQLTAPDAPRLTAEGTLVGTPCYVSPEVARGAPAGARSDVYSLACVLFELVTGAPPFDEVTALGTLVRKAREDPPTLSAFGVAASREVEAVIARGLARDPEARFQSAGALLDAAARAAGAAREAPRARRPRRERSASLLLLAGVVLLVVGVVLAILADARRGGGQPASWAEEAVLP
ncbi:MAG: serine/threonine protein kinase [Sandaracinaceae bacterium]|nr:serine/threonine protein kinase [Sandaracinaceae bacterium]